MSVIRCFHEEEIRESGIIWNNKTMDFIITITFFLCD